MNIPIRPRPPLRPGARGLARPVDRVEAAAAVLILTAALAVIWAAVVATGFVTDQVVSQQRFNASQVAYRAVGTVTAAEHPARPPLPPGDGINAPWPTTIAWTAPDGTPRGEELLLAGPHVKGDAVPVTVRTDGTASVDGGDLAPGLVGAVAGFFTLLTGWALVGLLWVGTRRLFIVWNGRRWAAEWRAVEPRWSGRAG